MNAIIKHFADMPFEKHPKFEGVFKKDISTNAENGRLSAHHIKIVPGGEIAPHTHEVVEVFYILQGKGSALVNGERQAASAGTVIIAPAGSEHGIKNDGEEDLFMYAVFSPGTI